MSDKLLCIKCLTLKSYPNSPFLDGEYYKYVRKDNDYHVYIPDWGNVPVCRFSINGRYDALDLKEYFKTLEEIRDEKIKDLLVGEE